MDCEAADGWVTAMEIYIATDFSPYPAGRTGRDGPFNGTRFRKEILVPALIKSARTGENVIVDFDNVRSFGTSFLDEAFGGLVRSEGFQKRDLHNRLVLRATKPIYQTYKRLAVRYIDEAIPETSASVA